MTIISAQELKLVQIHNNKIARVAKNLNWKRLNDWILDANDSGRNRLEFISSKLCSNWWFFDLATMLDYKQRKQLADRLLPILQEKLNPLGYIVTNFTDTITISW